MCGGEDRGLRRRVFLEGTERGILMLLRGRGDGGVWSLGHFDFFLYRVGGWGVDAVSKA
jgi:hypothetical protein